MLPIPIEIVLFGGCLVGVVLVRGQRLLLGWALTAGFGVVALLFASRGGLESPAAFVAVGLIAVGLQMGAVQRRGRGLPVLAAGITMLVVLLFLPR